MKKKLLAIILIAAVSMSTLAGCSFGSSSSDTDDINEMSKSDVIAKYNELEAAYNEQAEQLEQAQDSLSALSEDGTVTEAISTMGDGTGRFTFNSTDSRIIFPSSFAYPDSTAIVPDGQIDIVSSISVTPSSSWISRINGSALELEQSTNGISGTIKVSEVEEQVAVDDLGNEVLNPWFEDMYADTVSYSDIYIDSVSFGKQAETPIMIDSENAYLICGMASYGSYAIIYIFVYRGTEDSTKNELIKSLINTIKIEGNELLVQN